MPIRFLNAYSRYGSSSAVLGDVTGTLAGDITAPTIFAGAAAARLNDLSSFVRGTYVLDSSVSGALASALAGLSAAIVGDTENNPLYPPATVGLEIL